MICDQGKFRVVCLEKESKSAKFSNFNFKSKLAKTFNNTAFQNGIIMNAKEAR